PLRRVPLRLDAPAGEIALSIPPGGHISAAGQQQSGTAGRRAHIPGEQRLPACPPDRGLVRAVLTGISPPIDLELHKVPSPSSLNQYMSGSSGHAEPKRNFRRRRACPCICGKTMS